MKLTDRQMAQAATESRKLIKEHSTRFLDYNKMVSDDQIKAALTEVLATVTDEPRASS
jgi:hypothetical protein